MHLFYPVRQMRGNPLDGEVAALRVELADDDARIAPENRVESLGDSLECEPQFDGIVVSLAKPAVSDLCELNGVERTETTDMLEYRLFAHARGVGIPRGE